MASTDIATQKTSIRGLGKHAIMPELRCDDEYLLNYQMALSRFLREKVQSKNINIYKKKVEPRFKKKYGRSPKSRHEVRKAMLKEPAYQWWACLRRHLQEQSSSFKFPIVERQVDNLSAIAKNYRKKKSLGSLKLNNKTKLPKYQTAMDMHWMPGSYHTEVSEYDVFSGAMYDLGGLYIGTGGKMGPYNDGPGWAAINWLNKKYPKFLPYRVLDQGCTVGHSTLAYAEAWPEAKVTGIDFAAPVLRYGHARAESLNKKINFVQSLAEKTDFKSNTFDLVVSSMFLHETSTRAIKELFVETFRILKPGGLMLHVEQPPFHLIKTVFEQFEMDWDTHNNNEPFWGPMHDLDLTKISTESGFRKSNVFEEFCPFVIPQDNGTIIEAKAGNWFLFGSWK